MTRNSKTYIAGHRGLVGTALYQYLIEMEYYNLLIKTSAELDLRSQKDTENWIRASRPDSIILVAATHGGIQANLENKPEFFYNNLMINMNIMHAALLAGVKKVICIGASCVYTESINENYEEGMFLAGSVQEATEEYAWAKATGMKYSMLCNQKYGTEYISLLPSDIYGEQVCFGPGYSSVVPSMLQRFHASKLNGDKEVVIWGDGTAKREFLHVDDLIRAIVLLLEMKCRYVLYNIRSGELISIQELAKMISKVVGYSGRITNDLSKPGGAHRQVMNTVRIKKAGCTPQTNLKRGISELHQYALENKRFDNMKGGSNR